MRRLASALVHSTLIHLALIGFVLLQSIKNSNWLSQKLRFGARNAPGEVQMIWSGHPGATSARQEAPTASPRDAFRSANSSSPASNGQEGLNLQPTGSLVVLNGSPEYPILSRRAGEEGKVTLRFTLAPDGTAQDVSVVESSGHSRLDRAAMDFVKSTRLNLNLPSPVGKPLQLSFVFSLKN